MTNRSRRTYLATVGSLAVGGLATLAGCAGGDGSPSTTAGTTPGDTTTDGTGTDDLRVDVVADRLEVPWDLAIAPSGDLYFTERPGRIGRLDLESGAVETLATLSDTVSTGESGLLGIALHPEFPDTPTAFVHQTYREDGLHNRILRYRLADGRLTRDGTVLDGIPGAGIHDGGRLRVGPDGYLYATCGDASNADSAQDPQSLGGKILRLNLDGSVPADNPYGNPVWSLGHRNPEGLAWHPTSGRLYGIEHGSSGHDEVNVIERGANYGWPVVRGMADNPNFRSPVLTSGSGTWAPSGGAFYDGDLFPDWQGDLLFATLGFSPGDGRRSLHRVRFGADGTTVEVHERYFDDEYGRLRGVTVGPDGAVYVSTSNRDGRANPGETDDRILRVRPA